MDNGPLLLAHSEQLKSSDGGSSKLVINEKSINLLLEKAGQRPLSVLCVTGPRKTGKSLLFAYMIKYLIAVEKDNPDWIDWNSRKDPLTEFKWSPDQNKSPDTSGIWSFNRPFIIACDDESNRSEVAVILMYAQTSEKVLWTDADASLIGLALTASSSTVFNVHKQIDEKCLSAVASSIMNAIQGLLHEATSDTVDLQNYFGQAFFAIRDWNFPTAYPYGMASGDKFVREEKFDEKRVYSKDARLNRILIKSAFKNVSGCLFPFPGFGVLNPGFQGSIAEMEELFLEYLGHFISDAINVDSPIIKRNGKGDVLKSGEEWKALLEKYVSTTNDENQVDTKRILKVIGIKDTSLVGEQKEMIKIGLKVYADTWKRQPKDRSSMNEKELKDAHKKATKMALAEWRKQVTAGEDDESPNDEDGECEVGVDENVEKQLKSKLEERFEKIKRENEKKQEEIMEKWKIEMIEQYEETMEAMFPLTGKIPAFHKVQRESESSIANLITEFEKKGRKRDLESNKENFIERLRTAEEKLLRRLFKGERGDGESFHEDTKDDFHRQFEVSSSLLSQYSSVRDSTETLECTTPVHVSSHDHHPLWSNSYINPSSSHGDSNGARVQMDGKKQSKGGVKKVDEELLKERVTGLIAKLQEGYFQTLKTGSCQGEIEKRKVLEEYDEQTPYPLDHPGRKQYRDILESDLDMALVAATLKKKQLSKFEQASMKEAVTKGVQQYQRNMETFLKNEERATINMLEKANVKYSAEQLDDLSRRIGNGEGKDIAHWNEELKRSINGVFQRMKQEMETSKAINVQASRNLINTLKQEYIETITAGMGDSVSEQDLEILDINSRERIIAKFKNDSSIRRDEKLAHEHAVELQKALQQAFTEMQCRFRVKANEKNSTTKLALSNARAFYCTEMDKHLKNHEFIAPDELLKIHEKVAQIIMSSLENVEKNLREELREALQVTWQRYQDENNMNMDVDPAIGIDLGTTFCCVSVYQRGEVKIIPNSAGKFTTPSYVLFHPSGDIIVGEEAKNRAYENPEGTIFDAKRILGRRMDDEKLREDMLHWAFSVVDRGDGVPMIEANGKRMNPEEISTRVLTQLKKDAEAYLKRKVKKAVITVPAYFTDGQKQATVDAGRMAGLHVLHILAEPVAAAMAYKLQYFSDERNLRDNVRHILIYDLGGGTFDVAVLKVVKGDIEVLTKGGDSHLGGEDFDKNMMIYCVDEFRKEHNIDLLHGKDSDRKRTRDEVRRRLKRLQGVCEQQKIMLTTGKTADVLVNRIYKEKDLSVTITRATFEKINDALFQSTIAVVEKALKSANLEKRQIDDIVLVGGSTRIPKIQKLLGNYFDGKPLDLKINPDEAVAHGAGLCAAIKKGMVNKDSDDYTKVQDVTPMPIGVEVYGGGFSTIIPKGTKIPVKLQELYKTAHNNQTSVQITIYEGEQPIAVNNKKLGDFYLNGIPPNDAGVENIEVELVIDDRGILHVTPKCTSTGTSKVIKVMENKQRMGEAAIKRYLAAADPVAG